MLRRTAIKCHERRGDCLGLEPTEKKARKKKARARAMSWDYSGIQQIPHRLDDLLVNPAGLENDATKSEVTSPSLGLTYQTIMAQHKQTQGDSKKARVATEQLQVAVSKIPKTCSEIGERIGTIEAQADVWKQIWGRWCNKPPCMILNSLTFNVKLRTLKTDNVVIIYVYWGYKKEQKGKTQGTI
ncbi:hypothetical protein NDU88_003488 [Pleurodeles waltl]|uniref:Uncharacterized protein n=1 Tax=Pleurodeles waltl TaxID=8319 RepID=A0AAV7LIP3_PLEWA|nr:hypothetical protein NDU88_003488 [Pleurodeles waltl]